MTLTLILIILPHQNILITIIPQSSLMIRTDLRLRERSRKITLRSRHVVESVALSVRPSFGAAEDFPDAADEEGTYDRDAADDEDDPYL